jgi:uncharacterized repeat protein (TIGR03803 family)
MTHASTRLLLIAMLFLVAFNSQNVFAQQTDTVSFAATIRKTNVQLYGVAFEGGVYGAGTIFNTNVDGTGLRVLHNFNGLDGGSPYGSLIQTADSSIFGMTTQGGTSAYPHGVIFKINPDGSDYTVVREFRSDTGDNPFGSLMQTTDGVLVGTTYAGGSFNHGTIFKMKTDGSNYTVIHSFQESEGYIPRCTMFQGADGVLYGMTPWGGSLVFGTIFSIKLDGSDFKVLHNFSREIPQGSLIQASDGTLLGMTTEGGLYGVGVIFRIDPDGSDYSTLFDFNNLNGRFPTGSLILGENNTIYGTTDAGGPFFENGAVQGGGTIFKINFDGTGHTILHNFITPTGSTPAGISLILHENKLFGYTSAGGLHNGGVIFNFDLSTSTYNKLADLSNATGKSAAFGSLLLLDSVVPASGVQNFSLVDVRTGTKLFDFDDSLSLDAGHPDFEHMTIRANATETVRSVLFRVNNRKINTENQMPFLLQGYSLRSLNEGEHSLAAEAYTRRSAKGTRQQSKLARIKILNNTAVTGFRIIDQHGVILQTLRDDDIINVEDSRFKNMNINALLNRRSQRGSVKFFLNEEPYNIENEAPYTMVSGNRTWWGEAGHYTVRATPYSKKNGKGVPGTSLMVAFIINDTDKRRTDVAAGRQMATIEKQIEKNAVVKIYPVPANHLLNVFVSDDNESGPTNIIIRNIHSQVLFNGFISISSEPLTLDLDELGLINGIYFLQVRSRTTNTSVRFIRE